MKLVLFGCSFFLSIILIFITGKLKGNTSKGAAIFKEEFDTLLFNLPWKSALSKPDHSEILKLSLEYKWERDYGLVFTKSFTFNSSQYRYSDITRLKH